MSGDPNRVYDMIDVENFEMSQRISELENAIKEHLAEYHEHYRLKYARPWEQNSIRKLRSVLPAWRRTQGHMPNPSLREWDMSDDCPGAQFHV